MIDRQQRLIRSLTDDYFHGLLDPKTYCRQRDELLDRLVGLEPPDDVGDESTLRLDQLRERQEADTRRLAGSASAVPDPGEAAPAGDPPAGDAPAALAVTPGGATAARVDSRGKAGGDASGGLHAQLSGLPAMIAGGVVAVVLLVWLLWPAGEVDDQLIAGQEAPARAADDAGEASAATVGTKLLQDFIAAPQWQEDRVSAFLFDWDELTVAEQEMLRSTEAFRQFSSKVYERIQVDLALAQDQTMDGLSGAQTLAVELDLGFVDESVTALVAGDDAGTDEPMIAEPEQEREQDTGEMIARTAAALEAAGVGAEAAVSEPIVQAPDAPPEPAASDTNANESGESATPPELAAAPVATAPPPEPVKAQPVIEPSAEQTPAAVTTQARYVSAQPCSAERLNTRSATCWDMVDEGVRGPLMRVLPAGVFLMGEEGDPAATPVHEAQLDKPIAIGLNEVTVAEYLAFCRETGQRCPEQRWTSDLYPVVDVSWQDAVAYTNWLTRQTGASYRLPTEAEWEYAARAGTATRYPFGDTVAPTDARYDSGRGSIAPLPTDDRTTQKNGFRLWHMSGNVREWTSDVWRENYATDATDPGRRAIRGGSFADPPERLRSAAREEASVAYLDARTGFRVVREL